jgi:uncharacterized membrane protein
MLFEHRKRLHTPRNINEIHRQEHREAGMNQRIAVTLTRWVGSMECAYIFTIIAFIGLFGLLGWLNPFIFLLMQWLSQQFLQLVLLSVIMVGQAVLGRKSELMAEEQFHTTQDAYADIKEIMLHLDAQDQKILEILQKMGKP